jgi:hypothetical protein
VISLGRWRLSPTSDSVIYGGASRYITGDWAWAVLQDREKSDVSPPRSNLSP